MKIAVVGAGKLGIKIAESLSSGENEITLIDINSEVIQKASNQMDIMGLSANGLQLEFYEELGIKNYDYLIALTDNDEKNLLITSLVKKMGCKKVIARVRDPEYVEQFEFLKASLGIDAMINPDRLISYEIFRYLVNRYKDCNEFFTGPSVGMLEIKADSIPQLVNEMILNTKEVLEGMLIVAISRNGNIIIPKSHVKILEGDTLYVLGKREQITRLSGQVADNSPSQGIKKVMIMGGGKTGYYLSQLLSEADISVKVVEKNRERCEYLAEHLPDVLVLHGDATDTALLEDENISGMDAFVTATGYDEDNLLLALTAKQYGVPEVVAKVSKKSYSELTEKLGINATLNTLDITASYILRIIQGSGLVSASLFLQGQAEIVEVIANKNMRLTGTPLYQLSIPDGVLIALILRDGKSIIPDGRTEIQEGDKVTIFCKFSDTSALERLLQRRRHPVFRL